MSLNLNIVYKRKIIVKSTGKEETQVQYGDLWQTPTKITLEAMQKPAVQEQLEVYKQWCLKQREVVQQPVYADNDLFGDGEPISYEDYCAVDKHLEGLEKDIVMMQQQGYEFFIQPM
jgi:hypothetical protein